MSKRKLVPAALHAELSEYSSLIRALRTSNTLDVTSHIAKLGPGHDDLDLNSDDDEVLSEDEVLANDVQPHEQEYDTDTMTNLDFPPSTAYDSQNSPSQASETTKDPLSFSGSQKRRREDSSSPLRPRKRDIWTRWPLLMDDVYVPEWSFEDEVALLATRTLKSRRQPIVSVTNSFDQLGDCLAELVDVDEYDADSSFLPHLTNAASNHLSTIMALLVAHTPNRSLGLQNRVEPLGWRAVLEVLSSCANPSVADPKIIKIVESRMETLYGLPDSHNNPASEILGSPILGLPA
ncbi:hypothetical protein H0H81_004777 [Sphagnurus paluster]|uniref:Uncharacterized protein n=1 Tax=Sphagnurus paluster TaxID=117069 RepID=A0A9P7GM16_9AGAR|nr:hypothetical protein H0H81_004777 [Sphagnurus paluster]